MYKHCKMTPIVDTRPHGTSVYRAMGVASTRALPPLCTEPNIGFRDNIIRRFKCGSTFVRRVAAGNTLQSGKVKGVA